MNSNEKYVQLVRKKTLPVFVSNVLFRTHSYVLIGKYIHKDKATAFLDLNKFLDKMYRAPLVDAVTGCSK